jgi:hypothetical protein
VSFPWPAPGSVSKPILTFKNLKTRKTQFTHTYIYTHTHTHTHKINEYKILAEKPEVKNQLGRQSTDNRIKLLDYFTTMYKLLPLVLNGTRYRDYE